jgi:hypothetical protein
MNGTIGRCAEAVGSTGVTLPPPTGSAAVDNRRSCCGRYRADRQPDDALQYAAA